MAAKLCTVCNTRKAATKAQDLDANTLTMCSTCYTESGLENDHTDNGHAEPVAGCPLCTPPAAAVAGHATSPAAGTSHEACTHPRTKAGRAACRRARAKGEVLAPVEAPALSATTEARIQLEVDTDGDDDVIQLLIDTADEDDDLLEELDGDAYADAVLASL